MLVFAVRLPQVYITKGYYMLATIKKAIKKIPAIKNLLDQKDALLAEITRKEAIIDQLLAVKTPALFVPIGHFYSPLPSMEEAIRDIPSVFGRVLRSLPGIDMREKEQFSFLEKCIPLYREMPFKATKTDGLRYYFENPAYSYSDAIFLYCMLRTAQPKRIIEVGSGFSSCAMLDTNELFFKNSIETTFIEPYPELLNSLLKESDKHQTKIISVRLQDVELDEFDKLKENDILFIDSTHVSKFNSDVNSVLFNILPRLAPGVLVHFHDIFFPFEYIREWILEGRAWNESYLLRAFLQYNKNFEIVLMNTYMEQFHEDFFVANMPLCLKNKGGSIWLRKTNPL